MAALRQDQVLLVIPFYNHHHTLTQVVTAAQESGWQVLVVDDGSERPADSEDIGCKVVRLPKNCGKGAAIVKGAEIALKFGFTAMLTLDADGQHDPADALHLLNLAQQQWPALIIGNRKMDGEHVPGASLFGRAFSNFWVRLETGLSLPDTQSGMRLYPLRELGKLSLFTRRYDFEIESLVRLAWGNIPLLSADIAVHYPPPGERISHFHKLRDNARLSLLHTLLVLRALWPWPHKKLSESTQKKEPSLLFHPVKLFKALLREHTTPLQIATAVWLGIFLGSLPLIAVHTLAIIYACHKLHLNKMAAVAASQLCMPPLVPFLCIQAGFFLRFGHFLHKFSMETLVHQIGARLWEYLLGSLVLGPLLGLVVALASYLAVLAIQKHGLPK
jgi:glycosyltransferase involved in cell wall biosynthesis